MFKIDFKALSYITTNVVALNSNMNIKLNLGTLIKNIAIIKSKKKQRNTLYNNYGVK